MSKNTKNLEQEIAELPHSSANDFDFFIGDWLVKHRRLKSILNDSNKWVEFEGVSSANKILGGYGNVDDNLLYFPDASFRAATLRSFNIETNKWSIWWLDGRFPDAIDVPVVGEFVDGIGWFFADDVLNGVPTKVRFKWDSLRPNKPRWEQAFSTDNGITWKTNWVMDFLPRKS